MVLLEGPSLNRHMGHPGDEGGGDETSNPRLRTAITTARAANMPTANIERAIKKGTGDLPGVTYEEGLLEGYGPGGVAIYIEVLTDNRNRTAPEIKKISADKERRDIPNIYPKY